MPKIFMIGWDGATFDLIRPWVAQGYLPNLARLLERGVHGPLRSTLPPWTFPAWTSFMTGKNPGKHGIFDFFRPREGTYDLEFVKGGHRCGPTFWQILSDAGRSVVSISLPCTFPPDPVNGVMISGFDFPGEGPGSFVDPEGMYPRELYAELNRNVGRHPIDAAVISEINRGRFDLVLERMLETIHRKAATARYLMNHRPWDCFMILFGESDGAGHQFWKYCDPKSPLFTDQRPDLRDSILRVYQALDRETGELLSHLPADATVLIMSDHGFGGVSNWVLYPNCWLREQGFLRLRGQTKHRMARALERLKLWGVRALPAWLQRGIYRFAPWLVGRLEARTRYGMIDWGGTLAYFDENPYFPVLRVNLKGRQPHGVVEPGPDYEEVCRRLVRDLEAWRHPETGAPIVEKAYRREEIYAGPCLEQAADIIPKWALHQGYSYAFRKSCTFPKLEWIEQVDLRRPEGLRFFTGKSGTHRDDGIFLAAGPTVRAGEPVEGTQIIDLAPTILALLDVPVPEDMDGRVLTEIFTDAPAPRFADGRISRSAAGASVMTSRRVPLGVGPRSAAHGATGKSVETLTCREGENHEPLL
jgi:predicted AlkP superfamily phosphohydrolase/phosphomutase